MNINKDIETTEDIKLMVDTFYGKVKEDELLSPVFFKRIPGDWQHHLEKMYAFWNAALLGIPGYRGAPFVPHATMNIGEEHFNRWLLLFTETIDELFEGSMAEDAVKRANLMAKLFQSKLQDLHNNPAKVALV